MNRINAGKIIVNDTVISEKPERVRSEHNIRLVNSIPPATLDGNSMASEVIKASKRKKRSYASDMISLEDE